VSNKAASKGESEDYCQDQLAFLAGTPTYTPARTPDLPDSATARVRARGSCRENVVGDFRYQSASLILLIE
jgi:hypothetical protein